MAQRDDPYSQYAEPVKRQPSLKERDIEAGIGQSGASAASSAASTERTVTLLPFEKQEKQAGAAEASYKASNLGFEKANEEFQKQLVAWRSGDAAKFLGQIDQLRDAVRVLRSGRQLTGPMYNRLPEFIKLQVDPAGTDVRSQVEKIVQGSLRETLGAQFTQVEGDRLLARVYNPDLPETFVAKNVEAELNKIAKLAAAREAMVRYYEENGSIKGYKPSDWLPAVEKELLEPLEDRGGEAALAEQTAFDATQGAISGEGIKGYRFRGPEEQAIVEYANSKDFTPVGYANLMLDIYKNAGVPAPERATLLDQGRELATRPVGRRASGLDYSDVDEWAMRNAGIGEKAVQTLRNMPESTVNFLSGATAPVIDLARSLASGQRQGFYKTTPDLIADLAAKIGIGDSDGETLAAFTDAMAERYGGLDNISDTLVKDPVGFAGDLSMLLTGGGTAVARAPGAVGRFGGAAQRFGQTIDPLALGLRYGEAAATSAPARAVAEAAGTAASEGLSFTSGAPVSAIREAADVGLERQRSGPTPRSEAFREGITGDADIPAVVETARSALSALRDEASQRYRSGMVDVSKDKSVLDFGEIDNTLNKLRSTGRYKGQTIRRGGAGVLDEMQAAIDDWRNLDPADYHTPEGFDALKQRLGDIRDGIPMDDRVSQRIAGQLYTAAGKTIRKQAPAYDGVMRQYSTAMDEAKRIEREFSLSQNSGVDTVMTKLTSRPGTRRGRDDLTSLLSRYEPELGAVVAGEQLSSALPRGLRGVGMAAGAIPAGLYATPAGVAYAASTSPRLVGEAAYGAGRLGGAAVDAVELAKRYPLTALTAQRGVAMTQQTEEEMARELAERYGLTLPAPAGIDEYADRYRTGY